MAEAGVPLHASRIHRALSRPNHLMGADRELVLVTGLATVILIFVVLTWFSALLGIVVYLRHISYGRSYRPTSSPWRRY
mgnify:CR=1 FL=1